MALSLCLIMVPGVNRVVGREGEGLVSCGSLSHTFVSMAWF